LQQQQGKEESAALAARGKSATSAHVAWLDYREKKTGYIFYYNTVTRRCQREKPKEFKADKSRIVPEVGYCGGDGASAVRVSVCLCVSVCLSVCLAVGLSASCECYGEREVGDALFFSSVW
jgi:hypothetical protein